MIKITNERELLPIVRNPLTNWSETEKLFLPLLQSFRNSNTTNDKYEGWAFSMIFIKESDILYQDAIASIDEERQREKDRWTFAPSLKNRNESIWKYHEIAIVIHLESWLWFG